MDPPLIPELSVKVRIRGAIRRKSIAGRPELPPVEIPERPLEQLVRFLPVEGPPVVPSLLIGPKQNAQVIDFEAGRAAHVAGLKTDEPALLGEEQLLGVPIE